MRRRKEKLTRKQKRIRNRITLRTLFLTAITLIFNTYAWFLYFNTVSVNLTARVDAWHVNFEVENEPVDRDIYFQVAHAYPGMTTASKTVTISNLGDRAADIVCQVKYLKIFDDEFIATEAIAAGMTAPVGSTQLTAAQLYTKMTSDYPFTINIIMTHTELPVSGEEEVTVTFTWPYESGDDEEDTDYGIEAYTYNQQNLTAIEAIIEVQVMQHNTNQPTATPAPTASPTVAP